MKSNPFVLIAFAAICCTAKVVTAQTGDEIIKKHIDATGGENNWSKINTLKLSGDMKMGGMEIPTTRTIANNKGMRTDLSVMGMECFIILTDKAGWMYMPIQPGMDTLTPMSKDQVNQSKLMLNIRRSQLADKSFIAKANYSGMDTLDKAACFKVAITDNEGNNQIAYFDATTYYMVRTEVIGKTADGAEHEVVVNYSNFQRQPEGIVLPMTESSDAYGGDMVYKTVEINKTVSGDLFKPTTAKK
ncbi:MAG: hypothetical protein K9G49_07100 [Taibaiella sp.]|nr:hypothetical protein [Taibaiella sp.]